MLRLCKIALAVWLVPVSIGAALATVDVNPIPLGRDTMANSVPVTMATDQPPTVLAGVVFDFGSSTTAVRVAAQLGDGAGNKVTSQVSGGQRPLDTAIIVAGVVVDPRTRSWTLAQGSDATTSYQGGAWTAGRTWTLGLGTDSVTVYQGTSPWVTARNWTLSSGSDSVAALQSGTWTVQQGSAPWSVSQSGVWTTGRTWTLSNGSDSIAAVQSGTWTTARSWTLASGTDSVAAVESGNWDIRNITGTVSLPTGAATAANQATANTSLASVDTKLTSQATAANQSTIITDLGTIDTDIKGTQPRNITQIGGAALTIGQAAAANSIPVVTQADAAPATQNVTVVDSGSTTTFNANFQGFITGTPTANSTASFVFASFEGVEVQVTGTWTGTLQSEISLDGGTTWFTRGVKQSGVPNISSSFTSNFSGGLNFSGMTNYRIRAIAAMTGTATVKAVATTHDGSVTVTNPVSESGRGVLSTFTRDYSTGNLTTGAFVTVISSTGSIVNEEDIFDTSGLDYYLAYAATCGALSNATNSVIISPSGGIKDFQIPTGQCVGIEAKTSTISAGTVNMTFYK